MKRKIFEGAATALITPMNSDYTVNYKQLELLVDEQINRGIDALVICGTTGEKSTLRYDEHITVIETAVKAAAGRAPIIAGAGSNDTAYSVELCNDAERVGADAFLAVTPYYNKTSQNGLIAHYNYIADRVNKPIILYNVPSRTGVSIKPETYRELSKHPNIVAVKEASGDISLAAKIRYECGDELALYSGNDDQTVPMLSIGASGVISVLSNILPNEVHQMCAAYFAGDASAAAAMQIKYTGLINALFSDVNPIPVKAAMNILGMNVGPCRLPLTSMKEEAKSALLDKLKECGCINNRNL